MPLFVNAASGNLLVFLAAAERPWDRDFLERIYDTEMDSIPYGDRAFVVPKG